MPFSVELSSLSVTAMTSSLSFCSNASASMLFGSLGMLRLRVVDSTESSASYSSLKLAVASVVVTSVTILLISVLRCSSKALPISGLEMLIGIVMSMEEVVLASGKAVVVWSMISSPPSENSRLKYSSSLILNAPFFVVLVSVVVGLIEVVDEVVVGDVVVVTVVVVVVVVEVVVGSEIQKLDE